MHLLALTNAHLNPCCKKVLEDKTVIPFWYKQLDQLLQDQLNNMVDPKKLKFLKRLEIGC
jgi:hypothetical protein